MSRKLDEQRPSDLWDYGCGEIALAAVDESEASGLVQIFATLRVEVHRQVRCKTMAEAQRISSAIRPADLGSEFFRRVPGAQIRGMAVKIATPEPYGNPPRCRLKRLTITREAAGRSKFGRARVCRQGPRPPEQIGEVRYSRVGGLVFAPLAGSEVTMEELEAIADYCAQERLRMGRRLGGNE